MMKKILLILLCLPMIGFGQGWQMTLGGGDWDFGHSVQQTGNVTSTYNIPTPNLNRKLEKVVDILGKETKPQTNIPLIKIYDDGTVEKRIVIE